MEDDFFHPFLLNDFAYVPPKKETLNMASPSSHGQMGCLDESERRRSASAKSSGVDASNWVFREPETYL